MHVLKPKHTKLGKNEVAKVLEEFKISLAQLPKIKIEDAALPEGCEVGDVVKIDRKEEEGTFFYYRVIV